MKLEDLNIALRPRIPWESSDLGCVMTRRDFGPIMRLWFASVIPLWIILFALCHSVPALWMFLAWWLKPLYDRVVLFHLSASTFGAKPKVTGLWRALPKLWTRHLFSALLWRRFSLKRSFAMPVYQLEGNTGKRLTQRMNVLANYGGGSGSAITFTHSMFEGVLLFGCALLVFWMIPEGDRTTIDELLDELASGNPLVAEQALRTYSAWFTPFYLLTITILEPFYVGAGFALYLNCRTRLEGWDVELAFRKLAARLLATATKAALIALALFLGSAPLQAQKARPLDELKPEIRELLRRGLEDDSHELPEKVVATDQDSSAKETAAEVLSQEDFINHKRKQKILKRRERKTQSANSGADLSFLGLGNGLAWIMIAALLLGAVYLIYMNRHAFRRRPTDVDEEHAGSGAKVVMGMEITPESLPDDVLSAARAAWTLGRHRMALSYLYRGALLWLVEQGKAPILESDTEYDCLMHARRLADSGIAGYFGRLTRAWEETAYAERPPDDAGFSSLCEHWRFQRKGRA